MQHSALLNVMIAAARKAARALKRDFGEVENLQVSLKGPANFVTAADRRAEETLRAELAKARPGYGFLGEEGGSHDGTDTTHTWIVDPLDGTTNFLHGIPQFAISIGLERSGTIVAGVIYNPITDELLHRRARQGRLPQRQAAARGRAQAPGRFGDRLRPAASRPRRSRTRAARTRRRPGQGRGAAAVRRGGARPGLRRGRPARRLLGAQHLAVGHRRRHASWCAKPAASSPTSTAATRMFTKQHIVAGNETMHRELQKLLKAAG